MLLLATRLSKQLQRRQTATLPLPSMLRCRFRSFVVALEGALVALMAGLIIRTTGHLAGRVCMEGNEFWLNVCKSENNDPRLDVGKVTPPPVFVNHSTQAYLFIFHESLVVVFGV